MSHNRLTELDALRGIAAFSVMVYHYTSRFYELYPNYGEPLTNLFAKGGMGVDLFFILSGFVIFMSVEKKPEVKAFVQGRFLRLYPTYWLCAVITFIVVRLTMLPQRQLGNIEALINLTMFQEFIRIPHIDGVYWSLSIELIFYAAIVLLLLFKQLANIQKWILVWVFCYTILMGTNLVLGGVIPSGLKILLFVLDYTLLFCIGIFLYHFWKHKDQKALYYSFITFLVYYGLSTVKDIWVSPLIYIVFVLFVWGKLGFLNQPVLKFLGVISYPLYLIHQNIGYAIMYAGGQENMLIKTLASIIVSIILATLIHQFAEKPSIRYIQKIKNNAKS